MKPSLLKKDLDWVCFRLLLAKFIHLLALLLPAEVNQSKPRDLELLSAGQAAAG